MAIGTDGPRGVVLVADDEDIIRRLTARILEKDGFRVIEARTGSEALDLLGTLKVQLVVSDIEMFGMSGFDLADIMAAHWPDVPLLLMSGHGSPPDPYASRFIAKPFTDEALLGLVETLLQQTFHPDLPPSLSPRAAASRRRAAE